jgi:hypothetical protein
VPRIVVVVAIVLAIIVTLSIPFLVRGGGVTAVVLVNDASGAQSHEARENGERKNSANSSHVMPLHFG